MTTAPTYVPPEQVYTQAMETAAGVYERTKNIQATADATAETVCERFGFPTVFAILAFKMASNWWRLKLTNKVTIEQVLTNVLSALIANELAEAHGLDQGDTDSLNTPPQSTQGVSDDNPEPTSSPKVKPQRKRLPKPTPTNYFSAF